MATRILIKTYAFNNKVEIVVEKQDKELRETEVFYYDTHVPVVEYMKKPLSYLLWGFWSFRRYVEANT